MGVGHPPQALHHRAAAFGDVQGEEYPDTLISRTNLAYVLRELERLEETRTV